MIDEKLLKNNGIDLSSVDVVAFDIFDTLLYRRVSPMQVHRIWANKLIGILKLKKTVDQVVQDKFNCSRIAKLKNILNGKDREYAYRQMVDLLRENLHVKLSKPQFYELCLKIETIVEEEVCFIPEEMKQFVKQMQENKKVICISDFYLPSAVLKHLLEVNGVDIAEIYVSSEYLFQKKTGRLYHAVLKELGITANKLLMLGDMKESDVDNAIKIGCLAYQLENSSQHEFYADFEIKLAEGRTEFKKFMSSDEVVKRIKPFSHVAFPMYIFIDRLYHQLRKDGCEHALFMSREGEFFKKLFDRYQEEFISSDERVQSHYFYVSRRATIVPSIHKVEPEAFKEIYKNYPQMSIRAFLRNLGLDKNESILADLVGLDIDSEIKNLPGAREYYKLLDSNRFQEECLKEAATQRELFVKYLDDMSIDYRDKGLYIVDVGYSGTSQNNIYEVFKETVIIHGYYMISYAEKNSTSETNTKKGILYDVASGLKKDVFTYNSAVIEMLSLASHCGVEGYELKEDTVVPIFHHNEQELRCYRNVIADLQKTIIEEFALLGNFIYKAHLDENSYYKEFRRQYKRFIFNPTEEEMKKYLTIPFVDNFAIYREYIPEEIRVSHSSFSISGFIKILVTKGQCLKSQNTHWIAAALYKLDMRCINPVMYVFSDFTMRMFDFMVAVTRRNKEIK